MNTRSEIKTFAQDIISGKLQKESVDQTTLLTCLKDLKTYECFEPCIKLLTEILEQKKDHKSFDTSVLYVELLEINYLHHASLDTCQRLIKEWLSSCQETSWIAVKDALLLLHLSASQTVEVLLHIHNAFLKNEDQILCLEEAATIADKILHEEKLFVQIYKKLLHIDESNLKALYFFKSYSFQSEDWKQSQLLLDRLLSIQSLQPEQKKRFAYELASIYLYDLEDINAAEQVLKEHQIQQDRDNESLFFDLFYKQKVWDKCLSILLNTLEKYDGTGIYDKKPPEDILHFRIAQIQQKMNNKKEARISYLAALQKNSSMFEAFEELVQIELAEKNWKAVLELLEKIELQIKDAEQVKQIKKLIEEIKNAT